MASFEVALGNNPGQPSTKSPGTKEIATALQVKPTNPRPRKPNYAAIHSRSLPLEVHPLPAFIPHNPLSYLRIAITLLSHALFPPTSHPIIHKGFFSAESQSIHVTDPRSVRALWEQGFWGKGSLSRSEPRWLDQEKRSRGIVAVQTSEEATRLRREERRQFKLERAKKERETIEQQLREEGKLEAVEELEQVLMNGAATIPSNGTLGASNDTTNGATQIEDLEYLQLTPEEAFFLSYGLGTLQIHKNGYSLPSPYLFRLYCAYATFPISENAELYLHKFYQNELRSNGTHTSSGICPIAPDNPFLLKYAVYHHFRSLGWIVRPGIKFAIDYLLYLRGPVFSHAEYAIMIIPSYSHPYWSVSPERKAECKRREHRDWWWLHRLNRVQNQVLKTLVLVYVEVPPPWDEDCRGRGFEVDVGDVLKRYTVREFIVRRWIPNRNRD
ncbi:uncharacterized protein BDR25DRAFT_240251 [Lindgomyces ingoldianus]|uniref:Uncharacterized protein n=1 Tax=Lindgomyces ingoldianus TaxID=673940 RepID=A0ACB6QE41_9PLEO|nr:uncharacterized protein BDR25DRAFT_240251 [Lindgomyces ingoldianus]KAF2465167.1 hypothetical protein BDR25DRAFT_240251 [Lindgomyces ingoldianus]